MRMSEGKFFTAFYRYPFFQFFKITPSCVDGKHVFSTLISKFISAVRIPCFCFEVVQSQAMDKQKRPIGHPLIGVETCQM